METILVHQDNNNLDQLIDKAVENKQLILLKGNKENAVLPKKIGNPRNTLLKLYSWFD